MSMLTINADNDPVFRRFHKPEDEKRSVVILPDDAWGDWLRCESVEQASRMLVPSELEVFDLTPAPR